MIIRKIIPLLIVLLFASCNFPGMKNAANPVPGKSAGSNASATLSVKPDEVLQPQPGNPEVPNGQGYVDIKLGSRTVRVNAADMMTVNNSNFTLTGQAPEGTVISANDQIALVGTDQKFAFPLTLVEGPNLIEIEASNSEEQTAGINLVLLYAPSP
jgi:hypothetical protein